MLAPYGARTSVCSVGWVKEVETADRYQAMVADYLTATKQGQETLVVSPTHAEGDRITKAIRAGLKAAKTLGHDERIFPALMNANLTQAERQDAVNYVPGDVLVFHQNAKGYAKGQRVVAGLEALPFDQAARFQVFHPTAITLAPGDMLRVTQNGKTLDGKHRLNNGDLYRINSFDETGNIVLANGGKVGKDYGHRAYGYCVTSHASQGKSVDRVLIGQSAECPAVSGHLPSPCAVDSGSGSTGDHGSPQRRGNRGRDRMVIRLVRSGLSE